MNSIRISINSKPWGMNDSDRLPAIFFDCPLKDRLFLISKEENYFNNSKSVLINLLDIIKLRDYLNNIIEGK